MLPQGWKATDLVSDAAWHIDHWTFMRDPLGAAKDLLDKGPGFVIIAGVPFYEALIDEQVRGIVDLLSPFGRVLPQGPVGDTILGWIVRDEGVSRFNPDGSYTSEIYTSKSPDFLDIHNDGAMRPYGLEIDLFALFCSSPAAQGGESILVSSVNVYETLRNEYPRELERLCQPFPFERLHVTPAGQQSITWAPIFQWVTGSLRVHCNRQRVEMAMAKMPGQFGVIEREALDALEEVLGRDELRFRCRLDRGDLLIVDDHLVLHGRDAFTDSPGGSRRSLIRVLIERDAATASRR
jgi:Taurine catabolism dioxygenase TauD, TfdA family